MIRNKTVLDGLLEILGQRGISLDAWEAGIGWEKGSIISALQPLDGTTINRNIKLLAHKLGIDGREFMALLEQIGQTKEE